jgi:3-hydroxy-9,10-secoandrosta-1,3,5(10)-triene-9,17-dione monooxygenase reductase component
VTSPAQFREVMGHFATGVAVVTGATPNGNAFGFTANSVASVSLNPLLVLVSVSRSSESLPLLLAAGHFALSFLGAGDEALARRFSRSARGARFKGLDLQERETGAPVIGGAVAWVDCSVWKTVESGDHVVVFGKVEGCGVGSGGDPLVFHRGRFGTVTP